MSVVPFGIDLAAWALGPSEVKWRQPQSAEDLREEWRVRDSALGVETIQIHFMFTTRFVDDDMMFVRAVGVVAAHCRTGPGSGCLTLNDTWPCRGVQQGCRGVQRPRRVPVGPQYHQGS